VFENRVLKEIFWSKRDEVTRDWRRLHNEELYDMHCSPNFIRVIDSRRMRWAGHMARMGDRRGVRVYGFFVGIPVVGDHLGNVGLDGDNIKVNLQDIGWERGLDCSGSG
jgi:hypothetical protein